MPPIHIIKSDKIYLKLLELDRAQRDAYFRENLLKHFREKFEIQQIPFEPTASGFDALMLMNQTHVSPAEFNSSYKKQMDMLDDDFWDNCKSAIEDVLKRFEKKGMHSKVSQYTFTVLLGDEKKLTMFLNQNYGGEGGIPGYVWLSLVPNAYTLKRTKSAIAHEFNHNLRYQYIQWDGGSLAELIISEGLAENFVEAMYGKSYLGPWVTAIDWNQSQALIKNIIGKHLDIDNMFEAMPYLYGDEIAQLYSGNQVGLPHSAGYTCGYYLVKTYLDKTNCGIEEATMRSAQEILNEVESFWNTNIV